MAPILLLLASLTVFADGMRIKDGRFAGGPTTILELSADQAAKLREAEQSGIMKELLLSHSQRLALEKSAGAAPEMLLVYNTRKGENDCCCDARNRGLWFSDLRIEVPHGYLEGEGMSPRAIDDARPWGVALLLLSLVLLRVGASAKSVTPQVR